MSAKLIMFKSKIHRATVTDANLDYEGSVTISYDLMKAANMYEYEQVHIWNVTNGSRLITYVMRENEINGTICINGAGAHLMKKDDIVIIATFSEMDDQKARKHKPIVVFVDKDNRIVSMNNKTLFTQDGVLV
jgi:aspartate 1-decarboxylase